MRVDQLWSLGPLFRGFTVMGGNPILTLVNGERYTTLNPAIGSGVSIERSPRAIQQDSQRERPFGNELDEMLADGAEKVREETLGVQKCDLYRVTDARGRRELCVTQDADQVPLLLRVWDRKSGRSMESRYVGWSKGFPVKPAFFEPDPRSQIEHLSYQEYLRRRVRGPIGPAPPMHGELLHGRP